ncbi:hypothetical protein GCM10022233_29220 [Streptomyces shaanxiensis]|uniref:CAP domain-containing protein n=1 Tax=Streptomyces shaanxiensis TaxID=653357 RepID=A0ABP7UYI5_9ACTN
MTAPCERRKATPTGTRPFAAPPRPTSRGHPSHARGGRHGVANWSAGGRTSDERPSRWALRTRRRDDWHPKTPKQRWARGAAVTLATSTLLGGIAFASIGVVDDGRHSAPEAGSSHSTRPSAPPTPGKQGSPTAGPRTAPTTPSAGKDNAKPSVEAKPSKGPSTWP